MNTIVRWTFVGLLLAWFGTAAGALPTDRAAAPGHAGKAAQRVPARIPGHYIVVEVGADGRARPVFHRLVAMQERALPGDAEFRRAATDPDLLAASGEGWRQVASAPGFIRGEFARNGVDGEIEEHHVPVQGRSFVLRVPTRAGKRLQLHFRGRTEELSMDDIATDTNQSPLSRRLEAVASPPANTGNRVDILVLGDGYTSAQQAAFAADAATLHDSMFGMAPYQQYASFVNWTTQFVASPQSGSDHPPYQANCTTTSCCADAEAQGDPLSGTSVDTAFDGTFCTAQIHRLATVSYSTVLAAASANPDWDEIIVLLNDPVYGGSGGSFAVTSTNANARLIVLHEYGHSFHRLADEYTSPYPGFPPCSDIAGTAPCEANVTNQASPASIKWKDWIAAGMPIPSPSGTAGVGLFEGARYQGSGFYRPQDNCAMRALGADFCAVCKQEYVLRLYRGGFGVPAAGIDLIEPGSENPVPGTVDYVAGTTRTFSADILRPSPDTVSLQWYLDGQPIPGATSASYAFRQATATPAARKLELLAFDATPLVQANVATSPANIDAMSHWRTWNLQVQAPLPTLSIADVSVAEGNSGTRVATFTVKLSAAVASPVGFDIATSDGSATAGSDYVARALAGETIAAGQTSRTFAVTLTGDAATEANETFNVTVSNVTGPVSVADGAAVGTILNDDGAVLTIDDISFFEGNAGTKSAVFLVKLSQAVGAPVTFNIATANGTATAGSDYAARSLTNQTILAGQLSKPFVVNVTGDTTFEQNETFTATASAVTGPVTVLDGSATATVLNDEGPTLSINDVWLTEGNAGTKLMTFVVTLSQVAAVPVSFKLATAPGLASAGSDYVHRAAATYSIPAGETTFPFAVTINGDAAVETNDTFFVNLTAPTNATIADAQGVGTIINDEGSLLTIANTSIVEGNAGDKFMAFTLTVNPVAATPTTFTLQTVNNTALGGSDFLAANVGGLTIAAGAATRVVNIKVYGDTDVETNETFFVLLRDVTGGATVFDDRAVGTITNDD